MTSMTPVKHVERFHLIFLRFLEQVLPKNCYALKGGCNLRFFFRSIRYSEDMDLDAWEIDPVVMKEKVSRLFLSKAFQTELANNDIEVESPRAVKQTETTQRWKLSLRGAGATLWFPTKIEFSRRDAYIADDIILEAVDGALINEYQMLPVMAMHYKSGAALRQKLSALIHRTQTQSRDIFDIAMLLDKGVTPGIEYAALHKGKLEERILSLEFETFQSQVVSYLDPRFQAAYGREAWDALRVKLLDWLKGL